MSSKHCYLNELVLVKNFWSSCYWPSKKDPPDRTYLGIVVQQYSKMEVLVKIISDSWTGGTPRCKNFKNPPTFEASEKNQFHVLNWEKKGK
jgi:hypothetical protein